MTPFRYSARNAFRRTSSSFPFAPALSLGFVASFGQAEPVVPLRGRFDDLLIFMVEEPDYVNIFDQLDINAQWGGLSAASGPGNGKDNILWWNFDQEVPYNELTEAHEGFVQTDEPEAYQWTMMDVNDPAEAISSEDAGNHYDGN